VIAAEPVYASGLTAPASARRGRLRFAGGATRPVAFERFLGPLTAADAAVLERARPPVLDVGCGPGRHVQALALRGVVAMGIDASPAAVSIARGRGTAVHHGSVFADVPGAREWGCALLLDGNVGIGGCPVRLLRRLSVLLRPGGVVLAEVDPPGWPTGSREVRLEGPSGTSAPFPWAVVGTDGLPSVAAEAGFRCRSVFAHDGRWFSELEARAAARRA
jgi:SAM-dependent methyltransferase